MRWMYSITDVSWLDGQFSITLDDLEGGRVEVRPLDWMMIVDDEMLPREEQRLWWPVETPDGEEADVPDIHAAHQVILDRQAWAKYEWANDL